MINNRTTHSGVNANNAKSTRILKRHKARQETPKSKQTESIGTFLLINICCSRFSWSIEISAQFPMRILRWDSWRIDCDVEIIKLYWMRMHLKFWIFEFGFNTRMNGWWVYVLLSTSSTKNVSVDYRATASQATAKSANANVMEAQPCADCAFTCPWPNFNL